MTQTITKMKIRTGDTVRVLRGKDRGKKAKVLATLPADQKVLVEGVNMMKKHVKARKSNEKGQRVSVAAPLRVANVQLVCPQCKKGTRVKMSTQDGKATRMCKKCQSIITNA